VDIYADARCKFAQVKFRTMKKLFPAIAFAGILGASASAPAHAIIYTWGSPDKGGSVTSSYGCGNPPGSLTCTVTFDNFSLKFDGTTWSNPLLGSGGSIKFFNSSSTLVATINDSTATFVSSSVVGTALNSSSGFTIANSNISSPSQSPYVTFLFDTPVTGADYSSAFITRISTPSNGNQDVRANVSLSPGILGYSAPGPLGLFAVAPLVSLLRKRKNNRLVASAS
jgi:hypothetical protein